MSNEGRAAPRHAKSFEDHRFARTAASEFVCHTWFERDRAHIRLETPRGRVVFELWDDDVHEAIDSGYLARPALPRAGDKDWQPHAVRYAKELDLIPRL